MAAIGIYRPSARRTAANFEDCGEFVYRGISVEPTDERPWEGQLPVSTEASLFA
jgi:hypothetical protein